MMKRGGRLQALSFHYYAAEAMAVPKAPATGFGEDKWAENWR